MNFFIYPPLGEGTRKRPPLALEADTAVPSSLYHGASAGSMAPADGMVSTPVAPVQRGATVMRSMSGDHPPEGDWRVKVLLEPAWRVTT